MNEKKQYFFEKLNRPRDCLLTIVLALLILTYPLIIVDIIEGRIKNIPVLAWFGFLQLISLYYAINLSFDSWARFSRYRVSQNFPKLDVALSIAGVILPFLYLLWDIPALIAACLLMAYSYYVSPDPSEKEIKPYKQKNSCVFC